MGKAKETPKTAPPKRRKRGFELTGSLLTARIRKTGEVRGFAVARLLTHWEEIAGPDTARVARPVKVSYGREGGFGATLVLLTTGANAPMLEMQKDKIRERVNGVYGYAAISRIRVTQTAPTGFAEGQAQFARPKKPAPQVPDAHVAARARNVTQGVGDPKLRAMLEQLAQKVLSRRDISAEER